MVLLVSKGVSLWRAMICPPWLRLCSAFCASLILPARAISACTSSTSSASKSQPGWGQWKGAKSASSSSGHLAGRWLLLLRYARSFFREPE